MPIEFAAVTLLTLALVGAIFIIAIIGQVLLLRAVWLYLRLRRAGIRVEFSALMLAQVRLRPLDAFAAAFIRLHEAGASVRLGDLERHYKAGGRVERVVDALLAAKREGLRISFEDAAAADLARIDPAAIAALRERPPDVSPSAGQP